MSRIVRFPFPGRESLSMSRQRVYCCAAIAVLFLLLSVGGSVLTARQEPPPFVPQPPPGGGAEKEALPPPAPPACGVDPKIREAVATLVKMCEAYDLEPHPLPAIPDDPPPHAGAM